MVVVGLEAADDFCVELAFEELVPTLVETAADEGELTYGELTAGTDELADGLADGADELNGDEDPTADDELSDELSDELATDEVVLPLTGATATELAVWDAVELALGVDGTVAVSLEVVSELDDALSVADVEPSTIVVPAVRGMEVEKVEPPTALLDRDVEDTPVPDKLAVLLTDELELPPTLDDPRVIVVPAVRGMEVESVEPPITTGDELELPPMLDDPRMIVVPAVRGIDVESVEPPITTGDELAEFATGVVAV
ncbi:hypothetical protein LTR08_007231 [Meristemomyces frigidus]|nr:hypothetical protein LTR08_007231 [Meristemomyces frigidus]